MPTAKELRVQALLARPIDWPCPKVAVEAIALEEDCRLKAHLCIAGVPTCGWGETDGVTLGMVWTQEYADERLRGAMEKWTLKVKAYCQDAPTRDNELAAMLCLAYNVGLGAFAKSTVLKCHLRGDKAGAARAFGLFNKLRDPKTKQLVTSASLTARRAREAALYLREDDEVEPPPKTVQAVEPESTLTKSPIMVAGGAASAAGALLGTDGFVQQVAPAATTVSSIAQSMGVTPVTALAAILVVFGVVVLYWRWQQRKGGWA